MSAFTWIAENLKLVGGVISGTAAIGGVYIAADFPIPATKKYVVAQANELKGSVLDLSGSVLRSQKEQLYDKKDAKEIQMAKEPNVEVKQIYQRQIDGIRDSLNDIDRRIRDTERAKAALPK